MSCTVSHHFYSNCVCTSGDFSGNATTLMPNQPLEEGSLGIGGIIGIVVGVMALLTLGTFLAYKLPRFREASTGFLLRLVMLELCGFNFRGCVSCPGYWRSEGAFFTG